MWEQLHNTGPLLRVHLVARLVRKWMKEREITHVRQDSFHCTFQDKSHVIKTCPIIGEHVVIIFVTQKVFMATVLPVKNTLDTDGELFFVIKIKVALNTMCRFLKQKCQKLRLIRLIKI